MLDGVNDSDAQAHSLVELVSQHGAGIGWCKLNLIPFNPFPASGLTCSPRPRVASFAAILSDAGIVITVRKTRGDDIAAACGQLAGDVQDRTGVQTRMARLRTIPIRPAPSAASQ